MLPEIVIANRHALSRSATSEQIGPPWLNPITPSRSGSSSGSSASSASPAAASFASASNDAVFQSPPDFPLPRLSGWRTAMPRSTRLFA